VLISQEVIKLALIVVADRGDVEELLVVAECDPEASIVFVLKIDLSLRVLRPFL